MPMEALDLEFFDMDVSERRVRLLPDGTECYAANYAASVAQFWYLVALGAVSPAVAVMLVFGDEGVRSTGAAVVGFGIAFLLAWHGIRYRRYLREVRSGCHMQGIFLFQATRDVVVRFHRALGADVECSLAKDVVLNVDVQRRYCRDCIVVDTLTAPVVIPASWLVEDPLVVVQAIRQHLDLINNPPDSRWNRPTFGYEGSYRGPQHFALTSIGTVS